MCVSNRAATNNIESLLNQISRLFIALPMHKVRYLLVVLLVAWLLVLMADIFWRLVPVSATSAQLSTNTQSMASAPLPVVSKSVDLGTMQSWYLFGGEAGMGASAEQGPLQDPNTAAATSLNLVLLGVLMSDIAEQSFAVIQSGQASALYKVGEELPIAAGVILAKVLVDRVIINNRGSMEALLLYEENQVSLGVINPTQSVVIDKRNNAEVSTIANGYRNQLLTNPMSMTDVIKVSIAKGPDGNVIGYRIRPGRDRVQFAKFGLQAGDVVTSINGVSLDDPAKAMELYGQLKEAKEATFVVKRGNQDVNIIVGLNQ